MCIGQYFHLALQRSPARRLCFLKRNRLPDEYNLVCISPLLWCVWEPSTEVEPSHLAIENPVASDCFCSSFFRFFSSTRFQCVIASVYRRVYIPSSLTVSLQHLWRSSLALGSSSSSSFSSSFPRAAFHGWGRGCWYSSPWPRRIYESLHPHLR